MEIFDEKNMYLKVLDAKEFMKLAGESLEDFIKESFSLVAKHIPFVGVTFAAINVFDMARKNSLLKKTCSIIKAVVENYDEDKINKYSKKLLNDDNYAKCEIERVSLVIDKTLEYQKTYLLGKLWMAVILKLISHEEFMKYSIIIDNIYYEDYVLLRHICTKGQCVHGDLNDFEVGAIFRLQSAGLIVSISPTLLGENDHSKDVYKLSKIGIKFINILNDYNQKENKLIYKRDN